MWSGISALIPEAGTVLTVTQLTERIRSRLAADPRLKQVAVTGELADVRPHSASGHLYFALRDRGARLSCVMFRSQAAQVRFTVRDGQQVVASGYVDVYPPGGQYQLYVQALHPVGVGLLHTRFYELAQRLGREGLFDPQRKRALPAWPRAVGVVTSPDGAAVRDILAVVRRRCPSTEIVVAPARVQGEGAARQLVQALERLARWPGVDVIIIGRGGGSADDLWAFNEEPVVRAVAAAAVPVISAVGHERDMTLVDLAADRRAPTPSAAAELAVPDRAALSVQLAGLQRRLEAAMMGRLRQGEARLHRWQTHPLLMQPQRWLGVYQQQVDELRRGVVVAMRNTLQEHRLALTRQEGRLRAADPGAPLARGYALIRDAASDELVRRVAALKGPGQRLRVQMADGGFLATVATNGPQGGRPPDRLEGGDGQAPSL